MIKVRSVWRVTIRVPLRDANAPAFNPASGPKNPGIRRHQDQSVKPDRSRRSVSASNHHAAQQRSLEYASHGEPGPRFHRDMEPDQPHRRLASRSSSSGPLPRGQRNDEALRLNRRAVIRARQLLLKVAGYGTMGRTRAEGRDLSW